MPDMHREIAIFGCYENGNFGDDLMGHLIAERLSEAGYLPRLWMGPSDQFRGKSWRIYSNIRSFVAGAACVVFGGGMVFGNSGFESFWKGINDLVDACEAERVPIVAISIGSHGDYADLNPAARKLVASPMFVAASVRLERDAEWLRSQGKNAKYLPDIVLTALPYKARTEVRRVVMCVKALSRERTLLDWVARRLSARGIEVRTLSQFPDELPSARFYHGSTSRVVNAGPASVLEELSQADVLVGTGLHIGMAALSGGAEFISYRGEGKTRSFMKQCDRGDQVIAAGSNFAKATGCLRLYFRLSRLTPRRNDDDLIRMKTEAEGHYTFLLHQIASHGKPQ